MFGCKCCLLSDILTCRRILYVMVTTGFITNAILTTIFNITIIAMVKKNNNSTEKFDWNESQKQNILGIFFWGFALTKIPSGILAGMFGSRAVSGYAVIIAGLLTILTPTIARFDYNVLLISRVVMGFFIGATWPAVMPLASKWISPSEQSVFMSCITSAAVGHSLSNSAGGFFISEYGWESVFYIFGSASILWSTIWFYLIYDSPEEHPRISLKERQEIERKMPKCVLPRKNKFKDIPWRSILTSGPVWAIAAAQVSSFLVHMTVVIELPSYLDQVLHYDIKENGLFSSLPNWGVYIASLTYGHIADKLLTSKKLSTTAVRKFFGSASLLLPSVFMIFLSFWGDNATLALISFCLTTISVAAVTTGHCANIIDISPNFSGTICGLVNMLAAFAVYFSTKFVAMLLKDGHTFKEWRPLFWMISATSTSGGFIYLFLCSGESQRWDLKKDERRQTNEEEEPLI